MWSHPIEIMRLTKARKCDTQAAKAMNPEVLLKAYVEYQSEDAFRELVASTLDEVYSTALGVLQGAPHLAGEVTVSVYSELARKAPALRKDIVLLSWLREHTCKAAAGALRAEDRPIDRAALKRERKARPASISAPPAPSGLAIRICQVIFLNPLRRKRFGLFSLAAWWPAWISRIRLRHIGGVAACVLIIMLWWSNPFHRRHPIIKYHGLQLTPASFAQLAGPGHGGPLASWPMAITNVETNPAQK